MRLFAGNKMQKMFIRGTTIVASASQCYTWVKIISPHLALGEI